MVVSCRAADTAAAGRTRVVITERDDGKEFRLDVGASATLRLSNEWRWGELSVTGEAVEAHRVRYETDPGYLEWELRATEAGEATLAAAGQPKRQGSSEPKRFRVVITVGRDAAEAAALRLLDDWAAAYVAHDRTAIDRILGEEFVMSAGRNELQTRAEYLRKVANDQEPHASITRDDERVRVYGDVVVVNHRLTRTTEARSFVFRVTDVCLRREGRWQLVNRHITELPQPR